MPTVTINKVKGKEVFLTERDPDFERNVTYTLKDDGTLDVKGRWSCYCEKCHEPGGVVNYNTTVEELDGEVREALEEAGLKFD